MSWGNRLLLVFIAFAGLIATLVYKSVNTRFDLVSKDYYREELRYQDKIDGASNAATAGALRWLVSGDSLRISLPETMQTAAAEGDIWFYCATDASHDKRFHVKWEEGAQAFALSDLTAKQYEVKVQLQSAGKPYYYRQNIDLP